MAQAFVMGQSGGGKIVPRLPTYSGQSTIYGDEKKGYMELLTNGDLTFNSPLAIDLFLVGGGGAGGTGGGGGGYTGTWLAQIFNKNQKAVVSIGMGSQNTTVDGGKYSINCGGNGGSSGSYDGGAGGSGGGGGYGGNVGGAGGSNGSNGQTTGDINYHGGLGGVGQAKTTKPFYGDVVPFADMLFSGGGGGGGGYTGSGENRREYDGGAGGSGGGGKGSHYSKNNGAPGVPNTGGGGGSGKSGGSGIVIIRWGY